MSVRYLELNLPFSIGATEGKAELEFKGSLLTVRYTQTGGRQVQLAFDQVLAFRWDDIYLSSVEVTPDRIYQLEESPWVLALQDRQVPGKPHTHFRLYFISQGVALDVIATALRQL